MKEKTPRSGKNVLLAAAGMIAAGTLVFGWLSEGVLAAESAGTSQVPTSYSRIVLPETALPLANSSNQELQKSNEEANYIRCKGYSNGAGCQHRRAGTRKDFRH